MAITRRDFLNGVALTIAADYCRWLKSVKRHSR